MSARKGQANTFWIIIGAVIALVVMVVLLLMFTTKGNILEQGVSSCEGKAGKCELGTTCPTGTLKSPFECGSPDEVCCIGDIGGDDDDES